MNRLITSLSLFAMLLAMSCAEPPTANVMPNPDTPDTPWPEINLPDYFPLSVGNRWYYSYEEWAYRQGQSVHRFHCDWEVVNRSSHKDSVEYVIHKYFHLHSLLNTYRVFKDTVFFTDTTFVYRTDTTFYRDTSAVFKVVYYKNDTLLINDTSKVLLDIRYPPFRRHKDTDAMGDTLQVGAGKFTVGVGFLGYVSATGMFGTWIRTTMALDSVHLSPK